MEKQFKVAYFGKVAGDPNSDDYETMVDRIGLCSFIASAEQIIDIVKNIEQGTLDCKRFGITIDKACMEVFGGRSMAFYTKEDVVATLNDVAVAILSTHHYAIHLNYPLPHLNVANLLKSCIIVFRLPFSESELPSWHNYNMGKRNSLTVMQGQMGIDTQKKKKQPKTSQTLTIGLESEGGVDPSIGIQQLQSALFQQEITEDVVKPVKETVSAGKSVVNWGRSFASWISKLVSSN